MDISLKPEHTQFIQAQLDSGNYASASDVVQEALHLLAERERRLAELRQKIALDPESIAPEPTANGETALARLQAKINAL